MNVVIWTKFNLTGSKHGVLKSEAEWREWIPQRFLLWRKLCWPSLLNQTHTSFSYWFICDDSLKSLTETLDTPKDDRFSLVYPSQFKTLGVALAGRGKETLFVRIDSDDAYHKEAVADFVSAEPVLGETLCFMHGYCMCLFSGSVMYWDQSRSPYYAQLKASDDLRVNGFPLGCGHRQISNRRVLPGRRFLVTLHSHNDSSHRGLPQIGNKVNSASGLYASFGLGN